MFENHDHFERLLTEFQTIRYDLHRNFLQGKELMATLTEIQSAQTDTASAVAALAARVAALPVPAASAADLDTLVAAQNQITASVNAIDPTPAT